MAFNPGVIRVERTSRSLSSIRRILRTSSILVLIVLVTAMELMMKPSRSSEREAANRRSVSSGPKKIKEVIVPASGPSKESATGAQKVSGKHVSLSSILHKRKEGSFRKAKPKR